MNFLSNILYAFPNTIDLNENPVSMLKFLLNVQGLILWHSVEQLADPHAAQSAVFASASLPQLHFSLFISNYVSAP